MMHKNNFVVCVKSAGRVLREFDGTVHVPFGSEFSLYLKNLNSRRAKVKVSIDGEDVLNGNDLVVDARGVLELERYLKDLNKGNKFKFIERTSKIEKHKGIGAEDGLICIEFAYEKEYRPLFWNARPQIWYGQPNHWYNGHRETHSNHSTMDCYNLSNVGAAGGANIHDGVACSTAAYASNSIPAKNDAGITVPGSESTQKFTTVSSFETDPSTVIVLKLVGELGQEPVKQAVTVKQKQKCTTCGKINKAVDKFCTECGTSLRII